MTQADAHHLHMIEQREQKTSTTRERLQALRETVREYVKRIVRMFLTWFGMRKVAKEQPATVERINLLDHSLTLAGSTVSLPETKIDDEQERVLKVDGVDYRMRVMNLPIGQMIQTAVREGEEVRLSLSGFYGTLSGNGSITLEELSHIVTTLKAAPGNVTMPITYLDHTRKEKRATVTFDLVKVSP